MERLVEGRESVSERVTLCDEELGQDSPAHRRRTYSERNSRSECRTNSMGEGNARNHGNQRRYSESIRSACDKLHLSRCWKCLIVILVVICTLVSIGSLVLAILTSLKVAKLEDSSLLAACPQGK